VSGTKRPAGAGNTSAMNNLALLYENGRGAAQDYLLELISVETAKSDNISQRVLI
jgi:TPR repeat protein